MTLTITKHIYWLTVNYNEHMAKWNNKKSIHQKERERMDDKLTYVYTNSVSRRQWHTPSVLGWMEKESVREKEEERVE